MRSGCQYPSIHSLGAVLLGLHSPLLRWLVLPHRETSIRRAQGLHIPTVTLGPRVRCRDCVAGRCDPSRMAAEGLEPQKKGGVDRLGLAAVMSSFPRTGSEVTPWPFHRPSTTAFGLRSG